MRIWKTQNIVYIFNAFEPHHTYRDVYDSKHRKEFGGKGWSLKNENKDEDGSPQKCLIGCGSAVSVLFQGTRVIPHIEWFI